MQFHVALAAQETFRRAELELGSNQDTAVELEGAFPCIAGVINSLDSHLAFRNLTGYTLSGDPQIQAQRAGEVFRDWLQVRRPSPTHSPASFDPWSSECC